MSRKELINAVAYFRTSSMTNVGDDKDTLKRQREAVTAFAKRAGYEIIAEYSDDGVKGADAVDARPGFAAMLQHIASNGVRTIIVETANRFARDLIVQETGWRFLQGLGVTLIAADSPELVSRRYANRSPYPASSRRRRAIREGGPCRQASWRTRAEEARDGQVRGPAQLRRTQSHGSRLGQAASSLSGQQSQALAAGHRRRTRDGWPCPGRRQAICGDGDCQDDRGVDAVSAAPCAGRPDRPAGRRGPWP